ncbi:MAG: hypothetical protein JNN15_15840 [Blastocatellia bacterium]|nr:hypothetical protein [Blastocatellia bacterium]
MEEIALTAKEYSFVVAESRFFIRNIVYFTKKETLPIKEYSFFSIESPVKTKMDSKFTLGSALFNKE